MSINKWQHHLVNTLKLSLSGRRRRSSPANLLPRCFSTTTVPIDPSSSSNAHSFVKLSDELFIHCHEGKLEDAEDILFNKLLETKFSGMCAQQILLEYRKIVFRKDVPRQTQTQAIQSAQRLIAKTEKHLDSSSREKLLITFMDMYAKLGDYHEVENLAQKISTSTFSLNVFLKALGKNGQVDRATEIVKKILSDDVASPPKSILTNQTLTTLLNAWAESHIPGDIFPRACEVFELFDDPRCPLKPNEYNYGALLKCVSASKRTDINVQAIMDDMEERGIEPNLIVFNMAMKIYLQWNRHDLADALLEQMQQKGFKPDVRTHNVMLAHWSKVGTREAAQRAEELLETIHPDPYSFNLVLSAWGRVSEYEKMWDLYERVKNAQSFKPDLVTISTLLTFSAKSEDPFFVQRADNLLHQNVLTGLKCDFRHYFTVIRGWLGAGKVDRAMEILKQSASSPNPTIKPKPASYDIIVREFVGNGKIKEAVDFLEEFQHVKKGGPDWYTWNYLLEVWKGATHPQKDTYVRKLESIVARGIQRS